MSLRAFAAAIAGLVLGASAAGSASAITSNAFTYPGPHTGFSMIDPMELVREADDPQNAIGKVGPADVPPGNGCFNAGVHVPQGALIKSVLLRWSLSGQQSIFVNLYYRNIFTGDRHFFFAPHPLPRGEPRLQAFPVASGPANPVDNSKYSYSFRVCLFGSSFGGARITYTFTNAGD